MKVVTPERTWKLQVQNDVVVKADGYIPFVGRNLYEVEQMAFKKGWIVRKF